MKPVILTIIVLFASSTFALDSVENLNIERYMGKWYEIAAIPQSFQRDCYKNTTAEYTLQDDDQVEVINSCDKTDGERKAGVGRARINPDFNKNSKLEVTFVKFFRRWIWSFGGDYWVLKLGRNYKYAVVGDPGLDTLWILTRRNRISRRDLREIRSFLEGIGHDTCKVLMSRTSRTTFEERPRLCDLSL